MPYESKALFGLNANELRVCRVMALSIVIYKKYTFIIIGILVLHSNGCTVFKPHRAEPAAVDIPAKWSFGKTVVASDTSSLAKWWLRSDDPLLVKLVDAALQANTSVNSAKSALIEARALRDIAAATLWPTVDGSASAQ